MSVLRIVDVDPSDPDGFRPFHEVYTAALRHGPVGEFATVWQLDEVRAAMADPDERIFRIGWAGWLDDPGVGPRVVATGWMSGRPSTTPTWPTCSCAALPPSVATATQPRCSPTSRSRPGRGGGTGW